MFVTSHHCPHPQPETQVHTLPSYFFKTYVNIISHLCLSLPYNPFLSCFPTKTLYASCCSSFFLPPPVTHPLSLSLRPKYPLLHPSLEYAQLIFFDQCGRKKHHTCKNKVLPIHSIKAYTGNRGITPFLNLGLDGGKWLNSCLGHFAPVKEPRHPLNTGLGGPQNRSGYFGDNKNLIPLTGFELQTIQPSNTPISKKWQDNNSAYFYLYAF